jgi:cytochrome c oxidase assembly protein subunit 15
MLRKLVLIAAALAFFVIVLGAYVRLEGAGLGCPDWPGCYGELTPHHAQDEIAKAVAQQGGSHGPVSLPKAWKEMTHRYAAATLGLLLLVIAVTAWRQRRQLQQSPVLPGSLVALVMLQGALGMWTVTLLLKPVIVTLHLLGGMTTLALLTWLALRQYPSRGGGHPAARALRPWAALALALVMVQIALGGWVSANYAALACVDFPTCHGVWVPPMDFQHGFQLVRELGRTAAGDHLAYEALTAVHWTHRVGALAVFLLVGTVALAAFRAPGPGRYAAAVLALLLLQLGLGITNVLSGLPLAVAVAHNAVAALLLVSLVMLNFVLSARAFR